FLKVIADARGSGPIDPLRLGSILARISSQLEIPVKELYQRFKFAGSSVDKGRKASSNQPVVAAPVEKLDAQVRAERRILGILLAEPSRWMDVQQTVHVQDFTDDLRRRLAEVYWQHQRDEGEPVLNEFLGVLNDDELKELAVELVDEAEKLGDVKQTLEDSAL